MSLGTFNTIGSGSDQFGGSTHVWARVDRVIHGGRKINVSGMTAGSVIPAGTLVEYTYDSEYATIKDSDDSLTVGHHYGLIFNDVCVPDNCIFASCAIVIQGVVWADAIDVAESQQTHMPGIEFIRNHMGNVIVSVTKTVTHAKLIGAPGNVLKGSSFRATIQYDENYDPSTVTVTMGGETITSTAVNAAKDTITIDNVTGDIAITVTPTNTVATPVISPAAWQSGADTQVVEITCTTKGASIYYTDNGNNPTSSSTLYDPETKITLSATKTIKAIAIKTGMTNSSVASKTYTKA